MALRSYHIAVGLFGLDRRPEITHPTLLSCVLGPVRTVDRNAIAVAHLNCPAVVHSPRSAEQNIAYNRPSLDDLRLDLTWLETQTTENISQQLEIVEKFRFRGIDDASLIIRGNALQQMYSQQRLASLLRLAAADAEVYVLTRPDLAFGDILPIEECIEKIDSGTDVITPSWHRHGGLNDRLAVVSARGLAAYTGRLQHIGTLCSKRNYFHPETMLLDAVEGLHFGFIETRASRVRADGSVVPEVFA